MTHHQFKASQLKTVWQYWGCLVTCRKWLRNVSWDKFIRCLLYFLWSCFSPYQVLYDHRLEYGINHELLFLIFKLCCVNLYYYYFMNIHELYCVFISRERCWLTVWEVLVVNCYFLKCYRLVLEVFWGFQNMVIDNSCYKYPICKNKILICIYWKRQFQNEIQTK